MVTPAIMAEPVADIGALASLYSQLAGVLAGFAFTALVIYLGREGDEPDPNGLKRAVSVALFSALTSLIISAILFTILAGAAAKLGPALTGSVVYGIPFGLSVLALFHAITLQALPYRFLHGMARTASVIVVIVGPTTVMAVLSGAVIDLYRLKCGTVCNIAGQYSPSHPLGWGLLLTSVLLVLSSTALVVIPRLFEFRPWMSVVPTYMVLGITTGTIVAEISLTAAPPTWIPSDHQISALLTVTFFMLLAFSGASALALRLPVSPEADPAGQRIFTARAEIATDGQDVG